MNLSDTKTIVWNVTEPDRQQARDLATALSLPPVIGQLLLNRNISTPEAGERFLDPLGQALPDPFLLTDMDKAVERIHKAKEQQEHVQIFGDFDVDGVSSTALLTLALREFGIATVSPVVPEREKDGYGLHPDRVVAANDAGVSLIVTVDNGISAHDAANTAASLGIDLLITDHHSIEEKLPEALAIINPKRDDPAGPFANLCGVAVAYHLSRALLGEDHFHTLAALGTIADVMPLVGQNRTLVMRGLEEIAKTASPGISALLKKANLKSSGLSAESIAFQVAPRLNAGGRMGNAKMSLNILLAQSPTEARDLSEQLEKANLRRREIQNALYQDVRDQLRDELTPDMQSIVLAGKDWHQGVLGIVAAKVQETHQRATILISIDEKGVGKGSGRSNGLINLVAALTACKEHLVRYGGHYSAAGLTIQEENIERFKTAFEAESRKMTNAAPPQEGLNVDALISFSEINPGLLQNVARLEPFGNGNPAPLFATHNIEVLPDSLRELRGGHLQCKLRENDVVFSAIGFGMASTIPTLAKSGQADVAFTPKFNEWRGQRSIQLHLKDIRPL